jgi:peroxiredoxin
MGPPYIGDAAPEFELVDQSGERVRLRDLRGSYVVLHFGTSWCPFCTEELPNLQRLASDYAGKGVRVLLVDVKEGDAPFKEYSTRLPLSFPLLRDTSGEAAAKYAPPRALAAIADRAQVPIAANLLLDKEGKIRFFTLVDTARFDAKLVALRRDLDALLAEHP